MRWKLQELRRDNQLIPQVTSVALGTGCWLSSVLALEGTEHTTDSSMGTPDQPPPPAEPGSPAGKGKEGQRPA